MNKWVKKLSTVAIAAGLVLGGVAPSVLAEDKEFDGQTVKVGVVGDVDKELWEYVGELAKKEEGITIEVTNLSDYNQPNQAVKDGSLDLNAFQHIIYLEEWNKENKAELVDIGFTFIEPMGVYSEKIKSLDELKEGDKVAVPNDPTNLGRALLALETAGVIEVDDAKGILPTVKDITKNDKKLEFEEVDAAQTPRSLPDVAVAVINGNYAIDAGLKLSDALFNEGDDVKNLKDEYKNIIVANKENENNPLFKEVVDIYQSDEVAKKIDELSGGAKITVWED